MYTIFKEIFLYIETRSVSVDIYTSLVLISWQEGTDALRKG